MKPVTLYAPEAYWKMLAMGHQIGNGCGTEGLNGKLVPDTVWGLSITEACNIHDFMYVVGETIQDKEEADRVFLNNMLRIIEGRTKWRWLSVLRGRRALTYYQAVHCFGGPAFWNGKNPERIELCSN
jgi:hypothetical protein